MTERTKTREELIRSAPIVASREEFLEPRLGAGPLLDVGCIDERHPERITQSLHAWIQERCPDVRAVDVDEAAIAAVRELGYEVLRADAVRDDLGGPYRTIIAAEVIEHVDDVGAFLRNLVRHLTLDGRLLLTTPNPFSIRQAFKILRKHAPQVHDRHTAWFDPRTLLEACSRAGLAPVAMSWLPPRSGWFSSLLARWRPAWSEGFALELRREEA